VEILTFSIASVIKVLLLTFISFTLAMLWIPVLTHFLYKYQLWTKVRKENAPIFNNIHKQKQQVPSLGGLVIWVTVFLVTMMFNLSREATWLPLFTLVVAGLLGLFDDLTSIFGKKAMRARHKLFWQLLIAAIGAYWFYVKLEWGTKGVHIPGVGDYSIGSWYIPLFIFVIVATMNAVNITDGLDGLAGGLLSFSFFALGVIALASGQYGIAGFCGTIIGALLAFLWFNIYPARFIMGDTGSMALGATLGVLAMLTNSVVVLPVVGSIFVAEVISVILQLFAKKVFQRKIFLSAPFHHHLEAKGWPEPKVVMRLWVLGAVFAALGLAIGLLGKG
jgi:phospho-N-acetylmuramoyl-pentapeptide-transferase